MPETDDPTRRFTQLEHIEAMDDDQRLAAFAAVLDQLQHELDLIGEEQ